MCEWEEVDLLLIAGDLFHRQPLMRELKEVNYLFSKLTKTKVVFIVGNHDYLKPDSYYHSFAWNKNVYALLNGHMGCVEFPEWDVNVYGLSYHQREITENLYERMGAPGKAKYEILLAHGGDEKHIPFKKESMLKLGYDYIALGHIHKPQVLVENKMLYAGALEPTDKNDLGPHGYVKGEITDQGVKAEFITAAKRENIHLDLMVDDAMTNGSLKELIREKIQESGLENIYKFVLKGFRDADIVFELDNIMNFGNIIEIIDETKPAIDFEKLYLKNKDNLLGKFINYFQESEEDSIERQALYEGVQALVETKRG